MKNIFATHYYDISKLMHSSQLEGLVLAGFTRRFFAFLIDLFVLIIVLYVTGTVLDYFGLIDFGLKIGISSDKTSSVLPDLNNGININVPEFLKIIFKLSIPVLYFGLITFFTDGYTLGKRIFRIRIVATNHKHLTLWHSIERSLGYYASSLEFGFGFLQYFIDYNRRTVHDRIAETIVIKVKKRNSMNRDAKMILGYIAGGLLVIVLVPSIIYLITSLFDNVYKLEVVGNPVIRWIIIIILLVTGIIYGIWSVVIQNTVGEGGPLEIGKIEISPKTKNLVVSGPYKNTRNPMLFGTFLIYLAFALFINSTTAVVIVCAIFVFMLTVVVKMEEKRLLKDFGDQYKEYRKKVSMFIPWFQRKIKQGKAN